MFLIPTCLDSDPTKRNSFNYVFMYIPIGPSKKQLYKIIIGLLLLLYLIFLGMYKPKAEVYSCLLGTNNERPVSIELPITSPGFASYVKQCTSFNNKGNGYIYFIVKATPKNQNVPINRFLNMIEIESTTGWKYQCEVGTFNGYIDNQNSSTMYSVKCPVNNFDGSGGSGTFTKIILGDSGYFQDNGTQGLFLDIGPYIMYVTESDSDIITAMNTNTQAIINAFTQNQTQINNIQNNTQNITDNLNDSSIDSSSANNFTSNSAFQDSNGLDAIIKAPLNFIQSLTSSTCSSISLTIPYIDANVSLPCMSTIYNKALGAQLVNLIALVINGVVLYRYCLKILQLVHNAKNPNKDELEVLDL